MKKTMKTCMLNNFSIDVRHTKIWDYFFFDFFWSSQLVAEIYCSWSEGIYSCYYNFQGLNSVENRESNLI